MTKEKSNPFKEHGVLKDVKIPKPSKKKVKLGDTELFQPVPPSSSVTKHIDIQSKKPSTVEKPAPVEHIATVENISKAKELKGNYLVVYSALKEKISDPAEMTTSLIGYQEIASQCNIAKRSVQNIINRLISLGLIKRVENLNTKDDKGSRYKIATD